MSDNNKKNERVLFETFKGNVCHELKEKGDLDFIIYTLEQDAVSRYWERKWYPEAYYMLALLDYLCRIHNLPLCTNYENIRQTNLRLPLYPRDVEFAEKLTPSLNAKVQALNNSIPEFTRFNLIECDVRDVY